MSTPSINVNKKRMYGPVQPAITDATAYTAPALGAIVRQIHIVNTATSTAWASLGFGATAATAANCFLFQYPIPPNGTYDWTGEIAMVSADTIHVIQQTATSCTYVVSGDEQ